MQWLFLLHSQLQPQLSQLARHSTLDIGMRILARVRICTPLRRAPPLFLRHPLAVLLPGLLAVAAIPRSPSPGIQRLTYLRWNKSIGSPAPGTLMHTTTPGDNRIQRHATKGRAKPSRAESHHLTNLTISTRSHVAPLVTWALYPGSLLLPCRLIGCNWQSTLLVGICAVRKGTGARVAVAGGVID